MDSVKIKEKGFASKIGFIFAAAGSAVGLGNIWRFPWQVSKYGGGAFVLVYLLMVLFLGATVMIAEIALGRVTRGSVVDAYERGGKGMKWIGLLAVAVPFFITAYYTVIGGWATKYTLNYIFEANFAAAGAGDYFGNFITSSYFAPIMSLVFMVITIYIVAKGVDKGIEKASKFLLPTLFIMLLFLAIYALALPTKPGAQGAGAGVKYYIGSLDFKALGWNGVVAAMSQSFFSLSLGMGIMVAYGSYTGKKMDLGKSALTVVGLDTFFALVSGLIIFPTIFAIDPTLVSGASGPGLIFIVLPTLFAQMPGGQFFGFLFFLLVAFAALTSLISLLEVVSQYTIKRLNWNRKKATWVFGLILGIFSMFISLSFSPVSGFMLAGKVDLLTYFDEITNQILMPIVAFASVLTVGWLIKKSDLYQMFESSQTNISKKKWVQETWYYLTKFIAPILIAIVLIMGIYGSFQANTNPSGDFYEFSITYGVVLIGALIFVVVAALGNIYLDSKKMQDILAKAKAAKGKEGDEDYQYDPLEDVDDEVEEVSTDAENEDN